MFKQSVKLLLLVVAVGSSVSQQSGEWLCADEKCSEPIGSATVSKPYKVSDDELKITVNLGDKVQIMRRPRLPNEKLYWVKSLLNNKEGLLHQSYLLPGRTNVAEKDLKLVTIPVEKKIPNVDIKPSAPTQVFDGTTVYDEFYIQEPPVYSNQPTSDNQPQNSGSGFSATAPPPDATSATITLPQTDPETEEMKNPATEPSQVMNSSEDLTGDEGLGISSTPASSIGLSTAATPDVEIPKVPGVSTMTGAHQTPSVGEERSKFQSAQIEQVVGVVDKNAEVDQSKPGSSEEIPSAGGALNLLINFFNSGSGDEAQGADLIEEKRDEAGIGEGIKGVDLSKTVDEGSKTNNGNKDVPIETDVVGEKLDLEGIGKDLTSADSSETNVKVSKKKRDAVKKAPDADQVQKQSESAEVVTDAVLGISADASKVNDVKKPEDAPITGNPNDAQQREDSMNDQVTVESGEPSETNQDSVRTAEQVPVSLDSAIVTPDNSHQTSFPRPSPEDTSTLPSPGRASESLADTSFNSSHERNSSAANDEPASIVEKEHVSIEVGRSEEKMTFSVSNSSEIPSSVLDNSAATDPVVDQTSNVQEVLPQNIVDNSQGDVHSTDPKSMSDDSLSSPVDKSGVSGSGTDIPPSAKYNQVASEPATAQQDELPLNNVGSPQDSVLPVDPNFMSNDSVVQPVLYPNPNIEPPNSQYQQVPAYPSYLNRPDLVNTIVSETTVPNYVEPEGSSTVSPSLNEADTVNRFGRKVPVDQDFSDGSDTISSGRSDGNLPTLVQPGQDNEASTVSTTEIPNVTSGSNFDGSPSETESTEMKHQPSTYDDIATSTLASEPQIAPNENILGSNDPETFTAVPEQVIDSKIEPTDSQSQPRSPEKLAEDVGAPAQPYAPDVLDEPVFEEEPWYSGIVNLYTSLQHSFSSSPSKEVPAPDYLASEEPNKAKREDQASPYSDRPNCDHWKEGADDWTSYLYGLSPQHIFVLTLTTLAVLTFSLGLYYLENHRRDVELVKKYNDLAGKLFIEQKEKEMLTQQLSAANDSMTRISFDSTRYDSEISELKSLLDKYKGEKTSAEVKEKETMKKYVIVEKNYNELRKILSQNKQKGERTALIADIQNLKDSITANNIEIASLKEQLIEKKDEIKVLNLKIAEHAESQKVLEKTLENTISSNHEAAIKYQDSIASLEKGIEESTAARVKLEKECTQLKKEKETLCIEKEILESSLQKYQRLQPSQSLDEWLDAKEVRVALLASEKKIEELAAHEESLVREKSTLEDKLRAMLTDIDLLNENYEKAEKEKVEAFTRLQVLSDYFKEKETQLQEELGTKEAFWVQKQSEDRTIYEQMRALREENSSFKKQNENLKHEILEQEASFKKLITSAEDKAHENWVALRHNERRLKETQMEAAQLRARLTALETPDNSAMEMNGDGSNGVTSQFGPTTSPPPPFMMFHPQGEFMPPPPLVPLPPSPSSRLSRPPPLGRISSPPPMVGDFTPPPPLVPYGMFMPPSASPPPPHPIQKPQPLMDGMHHRTQTDSQSSNHSSDSTTDKPRRSKR